MYLWKGVMKVDISADYAQLAILPFTLPPGDWAT
jgi:hypothetical protein